MKTDVLVRSAGISGGRATPDVARLFDEMSHPLETRPNDIDRLGHVNNSVVLEYFEAARWAWLQRVGLDGPRSSAAVVSRIEVDYLEQIFPGRVVVKTRFVRPGGDLLEDVHYTAVVQQSLSSEQGRQLARAQVTLAFVDAHGGGLCSLQEFLQL